MKKILLIVLLGVLAMADIGHIAVVQGKAYVHRDSDALKAINTMGLFTQDILQTEDGRLQIQFIDNTVISLGKDSRFRIKEYLYQEDSTLSNADFELTSGFVKVITGAISKLMPTNFVLHTKATKVISNGTIWSAVINENSEEYKVIEGRITLTFNDDKQRSLSLNAGESILLRMDANNPTQVKKSIKSNFATTQYEKDLETKAAVVSEDRVIQTDDDDDRGHGNDPDGFDEDNPGKKDKDDDLDDLDDQGDQDTL